MRTQTSPKAELFARALRLIGLGVFALFVCAFFLGVAYPEQTSAATSSTINFQARLQTSGGAIVADGNYNVEFKLYNASSSSGSSQGSCTGDANCLWTETRTGANQVRVVNGYLTVNLGSVTSFPTTINWNQQLWLTMNIGGTSGTPSWDGEMSPRLQLTAVPYAFQAGTLSATSGANVGTLAFGTISGTDAITLPDASGTVCLQSASACGFATGSGSAFLQGGNSFGAQAVLGTNDSNSLAFRTNSTNRLVLDTSGNLQFQQASTLNVASATSGAQLTIRGGAATSGTNVGGNLLLQGGAGSGTGASGSVIVKSNVNNSTTAFQIQNAAGDDNLFLANTTNPNLILNSSAESDASGWAINTGSGTPPASTTAEALYGNASLAINTSVTTNAGAKYSTGSLLSPSTAYSFSFYAMTTGASFTVQAGRSDNNTFAGESTCSLSTTTVTTTWTRFTCSFTTSGSITSGGYVFIRQSDSTSRTWYVDGVQLESANFPTNYTEGTVQINGPITSQTIFENAQNTTTGFQVQNAGGGTLLNVDTADSFVGIGTNAPANPLYVITSNTLTANTQSTYVATIAQGSGMLSFGGDTNYSYIQSFNSRPLQINSVGNNVYLEGGGSANVGIGSTSASFRLDVSGTARFKSAAAAGVFQIQDSNSNVLLTADTSSMRIDIGTNGTDVGQLYVSGALPSGSAGNVSTGTGPQGVAVQGRYAYVVTSTANTFQIFDVSDPSSPVALGSVATGSVPQNVVVQGRYAYTVNLTSSTLQIFDVSNPNSPSVASTTSTCTSPSGVAVSGTYAYVVGCAGLLMVFDVSNPTSPVSMGQLSIGSGTMSITVQGKYAYVTAYHPTSVVVNALYVVDISNPASPSSVGSVTTNSGPNGVAVDGKYAYVTETAANMLQVFNVSNPASPSSVTSVSLAASAQPSSPIIQDRYVYIANYGTNTLQVFDISTPGSPSSVGTVSSTTPVNMVMQGRYLYVINGSTNKLTLYDMGGTYDQQLEAGGLEVGTATVRQTLTVVGPASFVSGITVGGSLNVTGNIASNGQITSAGGKNAGMVSMGASTVSNSIGTSATIINNSANMPVTLNSTGDVLINASAEYYGVNSGSAFTAGAIVLDLYRSTSSSTCSGGTELTTAVGHWGEWNPNTQSSANQNGYTYVDKQVPPGSYYYCFMFFDANSYTGPTTIKFSLYFDYLIL